MNILGHLADIGFCILDQVGFVPALENMSAGVVAVVVNAGERVRRERM